ncbi:hypothetical protein SLS62_008307 [Diatrype stigma]|uniref:Uncharacterized protein n=1 Tax=Diatrype stigma TaxID=117547 RepID=A0AAN9UW00_9PEZI
MSASNEKPARCPKGDQGQACYACADGRGDNHVVDSTSVVYSDDDAISLRGSKRFNKFALAFMAIVVATFLAVLFTSISFSWKAETSREAKTGGFLEDTSSSSAVQAIPDGTASPLVIDPVVPTVTPMLAKRQHYGDVPPTGLSEQPSSTTTTTEHTTISGTTYITQSTKVATTVTVPSGTDDHMTAKSTFVTTIASTDAVENSIVSMTSLVTIVGTSVATYLNTSVATYISESIVPVPASSSSSSSVPVITTTTGEYDVPTTIKSTVTATVIPIPASNTGVFTGSSTHTVPTAPYGNSTTISSYFYGSGTGAGISYSSSSTSGVGPVTSSLTGVPIGGTTESGSSTTEEHGTTISFAFSTSIDTIITGIGPATSLPSVGTPTLTSASVSESSVSTSPIRKTSSVTVTVPASTCSSTGVFTHTWLNTTTLLHTTTVVGTNTIHTTRTSTIPASNIQTSTVTSNGAATHSGTGELSTRSTPAPHITSHEVTGPAPTLPTITVTTSFPHSLSLSVSTVTISDDAGRFTGSTTVTVIPKPVTTECTTTVTEPTSCAVAAASTVVVTQISTLTVTATETASPPSSLSEDSQQSLPPSSSSTSDIWQRMSTAPVAATRYQTETVTETIHEIVSLSAAGEGTYSAWTAWTTEAATTVASSAIRASGWPTAPDASLPETTIIISGSTTVLTPTPTEMQVIQYATETVTLTIRETVFGGNGGAAATPISTKTTTIMGGTSTDTADHFPDEPTDFSGNSVSTASTTGGSSSAALSAPPPRTAIPEVSISPSTTALVTIQGVASSTTCHGTTTTVHATISPVPSVSTDPDTGSTNTVGTWSFTVKSTLIEYGGDDYATTSTSTSSLISTSTSVCNETSTSTSINGTATLITAPGSTPTPHPSGVAVLTGIWGNVTVTIAPTGSGVVTGNTGFIGQPTSTSIGIGSGSGTNTSVPVTSGGEKRSVIPRHTPPQLYWGDNNGGSSGTCLVMVVAVACAVAAVLS